MHSEAETQLTRDAWLQHALNVIRSEGIHGVRIERLARELGVTKGSFYWHFQDRDDLRRSILDYWSRRYTDVVVQNRDFLENDPAGGLLAVMTKVRSEGLDKYELAMRAWADHDPEARAAVRNVYARRARFVRGFFQRLGFRGLETEVRARLMLCYLSWEPSMYPAENKSQREKLLKLQHELLTSK